MNDETPEGISHPGTYSPQEVKALVAPILGVDPDQPMDIVIGVFYPNADGDEKVRLSSLIQGAEGNDRDDICYLLSEEQLILRMAAACSHAVHRVAHTLRKGQ